MDKHRIRLNEVVLYGILAGLTFALKVAMSGLANIEPVSLMVMVFAVVFGWRGLYPVYVYVVLEILWYGLGIWNFNYLYIWAFLFVAARLLQTMRSPLAWAVLSGVYGLLFGFLCMPVDVAIGGFSYAATKWVSGIPFDIAHCVGNFVIALLLFVPLRRLMEKLYQQMRK